MSGFTLYLSYGSSSKDTLEKHSKDRAVPVLVAVPSLKSFLKHRHLFNVERLALDSGAFSVANSGHKLGYPEWRDAVGQCPDADEVFALDVIPSSQEPAEVARAGEQSLLNCERAWADGIKAIPTFHYGEPEEFLLHIAKAYPKIALGGVAKEHDGYRLNWVQQCFARVWPKKVHGFGMASREAVLAAPFHSTDASSWGFAPSAMGMWCGFTGRQISLAAKGKQDLWVEVREHFRRQDIARARFTKEWHDMTKDDPTPTVRLAVANKGSLAREDAVVRALAPTVRLAQKDTGREHKKFGPVVRLAHVDGAQGDGALQGTNGFQVREQDAPALLISYYYLGPFIKNQARYRYRDWVMDSGAFSAHNSGGKVSLAEYTDKCLELLQADPTLTEVFALDVIPASHKPADVAKAGEQSLKNCEEMWRQGVPAIPTFHYGEPEEFLLQIAKEFPKIALGGVALTRGDSKFNWLQQCFARVWPKKVHGFGVASEESIYGLPFHSVDATNWELAPCAFGNWQKFGAMCVRGSDQDLRSQVKYYLNMEQKARVRWEREMAVLDSLPQVVPPCAASPVSPVRLAMASKSSTKRDESAVRELTARVPTPKPKPPATGALDDKWKGNWWA